MCCKERHHFYALDRHADTKGKSLPNRQMDKTIYGA